MGVAEEKNPKFNNPEHAEIWKAINRNSQDIAVAKNDLCWLKKLTWKLWVPTLLLVVGTLIATLVR